MIYLNPATSPEYPESIYDDMISIMGLASVEYSSATANWNDKLIFKVQGGLPLSLPDSLKNRTHIRMIPTIEEGWYTLDHDGLKVRNWTISDKYGPILKSNGKPSGFNKYRAVMTSTAFSQAEYTGGENAEFNPNMSILYGQVENITLGPGTYPTDINDPGLYDSDYDENTDFWRDRGYWGFYGTGANPYVYASYEQYFHHQVPFTIKNRFDEIRFTNLATAEWEMDLENLENQPVILKLRFYLCYSKLIETGDGEYDVNGPDEAKLIGEQIVTVLPRPNPIVRKVKVFENSPNSIGTQSGYFRISNGTPAEYNWQMFQPGINGMIYNFEDGKSYDFKSIATPNNSNWATGYSRIIATKLDGPNRSVTSPISSTTETIYLYDVKFANDIDDYPAEGLRYKALKFEIVGSTPAGSGGGGECLVGKDHELMIRPNKFKKIKNLKKGDTVYTSKEDGTDWDNYEIYNYKEIPIDSYLVVKFNNGSEIKCTDTHQFMSGGVKKAIGNMNIGDNVMLANETLDGFTDIAITEIEVVNKPEICYKIEVEEAHTYITENYIFHHNRKVEQ